MPTIFMVMRHEVTLHTYIHTYMYMDTYITLHTYTYMERVKKIDRAGNEPAYTASRPVERGLAKPCPLFHGDER